MARLTEEQKTEIINLYAFGNTNCSKLAKKFNVNPTSIWRLLNKNNIKINNDMSIIRRQYQLNQNYFNTINTEGKAYFLGLLYADGCNYEPKHIIHLGLQEQDAYILDIFKRELDSDLPIRIFTPKNKRPTWSDIHKIVLSTKIMSGDLKSLGCAQNKTLLMKFPTEEQVPHHLIRHFIRGMFDGDGCFCITSDKYGYKHYCVSLACTEDFCIGLQKFINQNLLISCQVTYPKAYKKRGETNLRNFRIHGRLNMVAFGDWIYENATVYLNRKYNKYIEAKSQVPRRPYRLKRCQLIDYKEVA